MKKIYQTIFIDAPKEKVWNIMLSDETYREWTEAFGPNLYYEGEWKEGSEIRFIGPSENGEEMGLVGQIKELQPYTFVSIEYTGIITNGTKDISSDLARSLIGSYENYIFNSKDNGTELVVDMDVEDEEKETMEAMWKEGLKKIKELSEV